MQNKKLNKTSSNAKLVKTPEVKAEVKETVQDIAKKATKIYEKQIQKNKVLPYHCDYLRLEKALENYKKFHKRNNVYFW